MPIAKHEGVKLGTLGASYLECCAATPPLMTRQARELKERELKERELKERELKGRELKGRGFPVTSIAKELGISARTFLRCCHQRTSRAYRKGSLGDPSACMSVLAVGKLE
jgi:hypothetical protein